mgnify:FL=1
MSSIQRIWYLTNSLLETNSLLRCNPAESKDPWWKLLFFWVQKHILQCIRDNEADELTILIRGASNEELKFLDDLFVAGGALFDAGKFKYARECFCRILEINDNDNQDIRLQALMGKLECNIADEPSDDDELNRRICDESEELYGLIADDLNAASHGIRADLMVRLSYAKIRMGVFAIRAKVSRDQKMLQKHGWM